MISSIGLASVDDEDDKTTVTGFLHKSTLDLIK